MCHAKQILILLCIMVISTTGSRASAETTESHAVEAPADGEPQPPSMEEQIEALTSPDPTLRYQAVVALGEIGSPSVIPHLRNTLRHDPSTEVRGWALRALSGIDLQEAREAILSASERDADPRIRELALELCQDCAPSPFEDPEPSEGATVRQRRDREFAPEPRAESPSRDDRRRGISTLAIGVALAATSIIPLAVGGALSDRWESCSYVEYFGEECERTSTYAVSIGLFVYGGLQLALSLVPIVLGVRRIRDANSRRREARGLRPLIASSGQGGFVLGVSGWFI